MVGSASLPTLRDDAPLVGRSTELQAIGTALADPSCTGVVLAGARGVGKSRLARQALRIAADSGFAVATVIATHAASTIPFAAMEPLLGRGFGGRTVAALQSARARIHDLADGAPLVLLVDDAHNLDDSSATLLLRLVADDNVFPVVTVSEPAPRPDAVTALWKDAGAHRTDVEPLGDDDVERLVRQLVGGPTDAVLVRRLRELSQGLPLAVREIVSSTARSGSLVERDGVWRLTHDVALGGTLVEQIGQRLEALGDVDRDALATLGMAGTLPIQVAADVLGEATLDRLERDGLVRIDADADVVTTDHPLYGEVARRAAGTMTGRRLLTRLADALHDHDVPSPARDLQLARWRLDAGDEVDPDELLRGCRAAYRLGDHRSTVRLARALLDRVDHVEGHYLLGLSLGRLGEVDEAEAVLASSPVPADGPAGDRMRMLVAMAHSELLLRARHDSPAALERVEATLRELTDDDARSELTAHRAMLVLQSGDVAEALRTTEPFLVDGAPERTFVKAAYAAGLGLVQAGRADEAIEVAQRALPMHERIWADDLFQTEPAVHHLTVINALIETGQLLPAEEYVRAAIEVAREAEGYARGYVLMLAGLAALRRGHAPRARRHFDDAAAAFRESHYPDPERWSLAGAATAAALEGDTDTAATLLGEVDRIGEQVGPGLNEALVDEARAWQHASTGALDAARDTLRAGAERARSSGALVPAARLWHALGRLGAAREAVPPLASLADRIDGRLPRLWLRHLRAITEHDAATLEHCAEEYAGLGADLLAAESAADSARSYLRDGDTRNARRMEAETATHRGRCVVVTTPALLVTGGVEPLTEREQQIAVLAARGLSSQEIADQLVLSRRTVDNHLQRAFAKLGISSRTDLPDVLGRA